MDIKANYHWILLIITELRVEEFLKRNQFFPTIMAKLVWLFHFCNEYAGENGL